MILKRKLKPRKSFSTENVRHRVRQLRRPCLS